MAKLQDDPKVQDLVAKAVAKATKDAVKNCLTILKDHVAEVASGVEDKATQKALVGLGKSAAAKLKEVAA